MGLGTIKAITTILSNAPVVIDGANRLVNIIKEKRQPKAQVAETTADTSLEDLRHELNRLHARIDDNTVDLEQLKLIKELAGQNETLTKSLRQVAKRQIIIGWVALAGLFSGGLALGLLLFS